MHRIERARHPKKRYKTRKTNEIWLLGAKSKSGTLDSADVLWEVIWAGPLHGLIKVEGHKVACARRPGHEVLVRGQLSPLKF